MKAIYHYCECFVNSSRMPCLLEEQVKRMSTEKNIETPRKGLRLSEPKITGLKWKQTAKMEACAFCVLRSGAGDNKSLTLVIRCLKKRATMHACTLACARACKVALLAQPSCNLVLYAAGFACCSQHANGCSSSMSYEASCTYYKSWPIFSLAIVSC